MTAFKLRQASLGAIAILLCCLCSAEAAEPYIIRCTVRAYTPWDPGDKDSGFQDGITAKGRDTRVFPYGIAADPSRFPYGTRIQIPGYRPTRHRSELHAWVVDDTGGVIRRWKGAYPLIEVRFRHRRSALEWGEQVLDVVVIPPR